MRAILLDFVIWYVIVQLISLAALPLALRLFVHLPDRGYTLAKSLGILLCGGLFWLGYSYGLLRNEPGGAWLALLLVAGISLVLGRGEVAGLWRTRRLPVAGGWRYLLGVETLFLVAFGLWTVVRAYDPGINHTEQPMDLMFINGIWTSPTYPPRDPWLAGYAISYYYFGYWLLTTLIHLTGQTPEVAYNLGQACWYGLLLLGSFGVGYNLLASTRYGIRNTEYAGESVLRTAYCVLGGLLSALAVGVTGNLHVLLEWLHAQGVNIDGLARFFAVRNFPAEARVTGLWHIDDGWWWWRSSRVLADRTLLGDHIEVIDEFPVFSYILGDNHPHVLAMPFVLLVVALALNLFLQSPHPNPPRSREGTGSTPPPEWGRLGGGEQTRHPLGALLDLLPLGWPGLVLLVAATGGLIFMNTWDFPPYWLLLTLCGLWAAKDAFGLPRALWIAGGLAAAVAAGAGLLYFPYFLSAQSQAGGILPNFFNPTHLPQFLLMFGHFLLGIGALLVPAWRENRPDLRRTVAIAGVVIGLPVLFLLAVLLLALNSEGGRELLQRMPLAPEMSSHPAAVAARWLARPWTFLLLGGLTSATIALLWQRFFHPAEERDRARNSTDFALLLAAIGLLLVYAPEFVYLRDNFGSRMNTVFKFYYQGWLLLGLAAVYGIVQTLAHSRPRRAPVAALFGGLSLLLILAPLIYPVAGAYTKANRFQGTPTLNGLAYVGPDEQALIEWIRRNTPTDARVLEGKGASYRADYARLSASTGRATLLGWDGHESQWRGEAYGEMAQGRPEALDGVYRNSSVEQLRNTLAEWGIDYVVVGPAEQAQYGMAPGVEERLAQVMELAFESGPYRLYRHRE